MDKNRRQANSDSAPKVRADSQERPRAILPI